MDGAFEVGNLLCVCVVPICWYAQASVVAWCPSVALYSKWMVGDLIQTACMSLNTNDLNVALHKCH